MSSSSVLANLILSLMCIEANSHGVQSLKGNDAFHGKCGIQCDLGGSIRNGQHWAANMKSIRNGT